MEKMKVVSPLVLYVVATSGRAKRIGDLNGKTIGEVWNGVFKGDVTFPIIRKMLQDRYPALKIVPYTAFPHSPGSDNPTQQRERARRSSAGVKRHRTQAGASSMRRTSPT